MEIIKENLKTVRENIAAAAEKSGRRAEDITLVAVTKTVSTEKINEAISLGVDTIGENRVQEFKDKLDSLLDCKKHIIGHLQTNKVKYIVGQVDLIQSVDSLHLAKEIHKKSKELGIITDVLLEVNAGEEESKFGLTIKETPDIIKEMEEFYSIKIRGLMTVAPYHPNPEKIRDIFRKMHELFLDIGTRPYNNSIMEYLSMGMSNDYAVAIEEGANMVRIGSAIFGKRINLI